MEAGEENASFIGKVVDAVSSTTDGALAQRFRLQNDLFMKKEFAGFMNRVRDIDPACYDALPSSVIADFEGFMSKFGSAFISDDVERFVEMHGVHSLAVFPLAMHCGNDYVYSLLDLTNFVSLADDELDVVARDAFSELISWLSEVTVLHESIHYADDSEYSNAHNRLYNRVRKVFDTLFGSIVLKSQLNDQIVAKIFIGDLVDDAKLEENSRFFQGEIQRMAAELHSVVSTLIKELVSDVIVDIARLNVENVAYLDSVKYSCIASGSSEFVQLRQQILALVRSNWTLVSPGIVQRHSDTLQVDIESINARYYVLQSKNPPDRLIASMRFEDKGDYVFASMLNVSKLFAGMRITEELMMQTVLLESQIKPVRIYALASNPHSRKYIDIYGGKLTGNNITIDGMVHDEIQFG